MKWNNLLDLIVEDIQCMCGRLYGTLQQNNNTNMSDSPCMKTFINLGIIVETRIEIESSQLSMLIYIHAIQPLFKRELSF